MNLTGKVLAPEEEEILAEQRKRASSDTQSLIKIIDRLVGLLAAEGGAGLDKYDREGIAIGGVVGVVCLALCLWPLWLIATL